MEDEAKHVPLVEEVSDSSDEEEAEDVKITVDAEVDDLRTRYHKYQSRPSSYASSLRSVRAALEFQDSENKWYRLSAVNLDTIELTALALSSYAGASKRTIPGDELVLQRKDLQRRRSKNVVVNSLLNIVEDIENWRKSQHSVAEKHCRPIPPDDDWDIHLGHEVKSLTYRSKQVIHLMNHPSKITRTATFDRILGTGSYGMVAMDTEKRIYKIYTSPSTTTESPSTNTLVELAILRFFAASGKESSRNIVTGDSLFEDINTTQICFWLSLQPHVVSLSQFAWPPPAPNPVLFNWIYKGVRACLTAVHHAGFAHLDVKPQNFGVEFDPRILGRTPSSTFEFYNTCAVGGTLKLFDFSNSSLLPKIAFRGFIDVTYPYRAPEIFRLSRACKEIDGQAVDVWAAGVMLWEAFYGTPFGGKLLPRTDGADVFGHALLQLVSDDPSNKFMQYAEFGKPPEPDWLQPHPEKRYKLMEAGDIPRFSSSRNEELCAYISQNLVEPLTQARIDLYMKSFVSPQYAASELAASGLKLFSALHQVDRSLLDAVVCFATVFHTTMKTTWHDDFVDTCCTPLATLWKLECKTVDRQVWMSRRLFILRKVNYDVMLTFQTGDGLAGAIGMGGRRASLSCGTRKASCSSSSGSSAAAAAQTSPVGEISGWAGSSGSSSSSSSSSSVSSCAATSSSASGASAGRARGREQATEGLAGNAFEPGFTSSQ